VHKYLLRRFLITIPTLLGISVVLFTVLAMAPGDPFEELALNPNIPAEVRLNLRHQFGLDDPIPVRYVRWFTSMLRGDWGYSFVSRVDVDRLILQRLPTTLFVLGTAYVLALVIALPVGVMSAVRPYSLFDQIATTCAFVGYSLPTFFTGLLFILLFSLYLDWLPFIYSTTIEGSGLRWVGEHFKQAAMPIAVLGLFEAASLTRFVRASMLDVIHQDFITTARAKGLTELRTILGHGLRNALIPVITIVALQLPGIFTGAVITEQIFRVPGIGSLLISAIQSTDTPVVMAITFVYAMLVVVFTLMADIIYGCLDPRITYS
jgi:peptide/nickel transport system permease protein